MYEFFLALVRIAQITVQGGCDEASAFGGMPVAATLSSLLQCTILPMVAKAVLDPNDFRAKIYVCLRHRIVPRELREQNCADD